MKISMEIKDGKIVLTDEQPEKSEEKKVKTETETSTKSSDFFTGTGADLKKTYGIEINVPEKENNKLSETSKNIMNVVKEILKTKSDDIKNPNRFNTGKVSITMPTIDRPDIDQIADIDKDIPGYDRIRVFDTMERKCDITIINDGYKSSSENDVIEKDSDALHFIVNRNGIDHEDESWSQSEITIYPGEAWKIYNVYELRIRSEMQNTRYRITEDDIIIGSTIRSVV